jgi:hypothetical protein
MIMKAASLTKRDAWFMEPETDPSKVVTKANTTGSNAFRITSSCGANSSKSDSSHGAESRRLSSHSDSCLNPWTDDKPAIKDTGTVQNKQMADVNPAEIIRPN